jgi:hypothetical protein
VIGGLSVPLLATVLAFLHLRDHIRVAHTCKWLRHAAKTKRSWPACLDLSTLDPCLRIQDVPKDWASNWCCRLESVIVSWTHIEELGLAGFLGYVTWLSISFKGSVRLPADFLGKLARLSPRLASLTLDSDMKNLHQDLSDLSWHAVQGMKIPTLTELSLRHCHKHIWQWDPERLPRLIRLELLDCATWHVHSSVKPVLVRFSSTRFDCDWVKADRSSRPALFDCPHLKDVMVHVDCEDSEQLDGCSVLPEAADLVTALVLRFGRNSRQTVSIKGNLFPTISRCPKIAHLTIQGVAGGGFAAIEDRAYLDVYLLKGQLRSLHLKAVAIRMRRELPALIALWRAGCVLSFDNRCSVVLGNYMDPPDTAHFVAQQLRSIPHFGDVFGTVKLVDACERAY